MKKVLGICFEWFVSVYRISTPNSFQLYISIYLSLCVSGQFFDCSWWHKLNEGCQKKEEEEEATHRQNQFLEQNLKKKVLLTEIINMLSTHKCVIILQMKEERKHRKSFSFFFFQHHHGKSCKYFICFCAAHLSTAAHEKKLKGEHKKLIIFSRPFNLMPFSYSFCVYKCLFVLCLLIHWNVPKSLIAVNIHSSTIHTNTLSLYKHTFAYLYVLILTPSKEYKIIFFCLNFFLL